MKELLISFKRLRLFNYVCLLASSYMVISIAFFNTSFLSKLFGVILIIFNLILSELRGAYISEGMK